MRQPFAPVYGGTVAVSATTTSASGTLGAAGTAATALLVSNAGTVAVAVRVGTGAQTATIADCVILGGQSRVLAKAPGADTVAAITASGSATVYVTPGEGGV